jgi:hypothetical protein
MIINKITEINEFLNLVDEGNLTKVENYYNDHFINLMYKDYLPICKAIKLGHLNLVKYFFSITKITTPKMFFVACMCGHIEILEYLLSITTFNFKTHNYECFKIATTTDNLKLFRFLMLKCPIYVNHHIFNFLIANVIANSKNIEFIEYLLKFYTKPLATSNLYIAIDSNNIFMLNYISQKINKTFLDINLIAEHTIKTKNIDILQCVFVLYPEIVNIDNQHNLFTIACQNGNIDILRQLLVIYPNTILDLDILFTISIKYKHNNIAHLLLEWSKSMSKPIIITNINYLDCIKNKNYTMFYKLLELSVLTNPCQLFNFAIIYNNIQIANYLYKKYKPNVDYNELFKTSCLVSNCEMAIYLLPLTTNLKYNEIFVELMKHSSLKMIELFKMICPENIRLDYQYAIEIACQNGNFHAYKYLVSNNVKYEKAFIKSFINAHYDIFIDLLDRDKTLINSINENHIVVSCKYNVTKLLQVLINSRSDIEIPKECLVYAISENNYELVNFLIQYGIRVEDTYYAMALNKGNLEIIKLIDYRNYTGFNIIFINSILLNDNSDLFQYYLERFNHNIENILDICFTKIFYNHYYKCGYILLEYCNTQKIKCNLDKYLEEAINNKDIKAIELLINFGYSITDIDFNNIIILGDYDFIENILEITNDKIINSNTFVNLIMYNSIKVLNLLSDYSCLPDYKIYESGLMVIENKNIKLNNYEMYKLFYKDDSITTDYSMFKSSTEQCIICYENLESDGIKTICNHLFHKKCLLTWLANKFECPYCRNILNI